MTPIDLFHLVRKILAEECGCGATWEQHPQPLKAAELAAIRMRIVSELEGRPSHAASTPARKSLAAHACF